VIIASDALQLKAAIVVLRFNYESIMLVATPTYKFKNSTTAAKP